MNTRTVNSVMARNVVTARPDTIFKDLVTTLAEERVSALPIVDDAGRMVGVLSEGDLLHRLDLPANSPHGRLLRRRRPEPPAGPLADMAAGLMSRPAITISSDAEAALRVQRTGRPDRAVGDLTAGRGTLVPASGVRPALTVCGASGGECGCQHWRSTERTSE